MPRLRISGIVEESIVDGPGLRYVVFTQGCPHHCPGCHNPQTHDFDGGEFRDTDDILRQFMENPLLSGITFSGGEPFVQAEPLSRWTCWWTVPMWKPCAIWSWISAAAPTSVSWTGTPSKPCAPWRRDFYRGFSWGKEGAFFVKTAPSFPQAPIPPRKNFFQVCMPVPVVVWW